MKQALKHKNNRSEDSYNTQKGVTLVELVVVIFIIILITGIVLANYNVGGKQLALERGAYKLTQALRQAQEMAMAPRGGDCPSPFKGGYGIYLRRQGPLNPPFAPGAYYYTLFADCNSDGDYDPLDFPQPDQEIYRVEFGKGIVFIGSEPTNTATGWPGNGRVVFFSSTPVGNFNPGDEEGIRIKLASDDLEIESIVQVNKAGLIYVE